jgi:hypothetical protein
MNERFVMLATARRWPRQPNPDRSCRGFFKEAMTMSPVFPDTTVKQPARLPMCSQRAMAAGIRKPLPAAQRAVVDGFTLWPVRIVRTKICNRSCPYVGIKLA